MVDTPKKTNGDEAMEDNPSGRKLSTGVVNTAPSPATTIPAQEMKTIQMVPKTTPSSRIQRRRTEKPALMRERQTGSSRTTIICLPPKTRQALTTRIRRARGSHRTRAFQTQAYGHGKHLKKKQQQLRADQDLLADRWTEVLAAEEYELEAPPRATQNAGCYPD